MTDLDMVQALAFALGCGLIVGLERQWHKREVEEAGRVAGLRTFGLIGLLGGAAVQVGDGVAAFAAGLVALAVLIVLAYGWNPERRRDIGITTAVAVLVAFALGGLAGAGQTLPAVGGAVVTALLLGYKPVLHQLVRRLTRQELLAALRLILISAVTLPLLPDQGYGPFAALNPYRIWLMVVLISGLSFVGYAAVRIWGAEWGLVLTAMGGGLVSSTAVMLSFARMAARREDLGAFLAAGGLLASTIMYPRMLLVLAVVAPGLVATLAPPLVAMMLAGAVATAVLYRRGRAQPLPHQRLRNPLELRSAILFGVVLAAVTLLAHWLQDRVGSTGLYALGALSGFADVDALTLSVGSMAADGLDTSVAATAIVLAALANTAFKAGLAAAIAWTAMGRHVAVATGVMLAAGGLGLVLTI